MAIPARPHASGLHGHGNGSCLHACNSQSVDLQMGMALAIPAEPHAVACVDKVTLAAGKQFFKGTDLRLARMPLAMPAPHAVGCMHGQGDGSSWHAILQRQAQSKEPAVGHHEKLGHAPAT